MKRITMIALTVVLALTMSVTSVFASIGIKVYLNDAQMQFDGTQPQMINSSVYVPGRAIFDSVWMSVQWDGSTKTAYAYSEGYQCMKFKVDSQTVEVYNVTPDEGNYNGPVKDMTVVPGSKETFDIGKPVKLIGGRVLFPLRALSQFFGYGVMWNGETQTVYLQSEEIDYTNPSIETAPTVTDGDTTSYTYCAYDKNKTPINIGDAFVFGGPYDFFIGSVIAVDSQTNMIQLQWFDVINNGKSELESLAMDDPMLFDDIQDSAGVNFYKTQWVFAQQGYKK